MKKFIQLIKGFFVKPDVIARFVLLWDDERKEYCRLESEWETKDLDGVTKFTVIERFKTEQEVIDALEKAKHNVL